MPMPVSDSTWDFSPVFNLIQTLSKHDTNQARPATVDNQAENRLPANTNPSLSKDSTADLGDFNQLWDYLGVQRDVPPPSVAPFERSLANHTIELDSYASDGAIYYPSSAKSVKWRDEEEGQNLTDVQHSPPSHDEMRVTKTQRKKQNRKARKAAEQAALLKREHVTSSKNYKDSEDDADDLSVPATTKIGVHHGVIQPPVKNESKKPITKFIEKKLDALQSKSVAVQPASYKMQEVATKTEVKPVTSKAIPAPGQPGTLSPADAIKAVQEAQRRGPPVFHAPKESGQNGKPATPATPKSIPNVAANEFSPAKSPIKPAAKFPVPKQPASVVKQALADEPKTPVRPAINSVHDSMQKQGPTTKPAAAPQTSLLTQALAAMANTTPPAKNVTHTTPATQPTKPSTPMQKTSMPASHPTPPTQPAKPSTPMQKTPASGSQTPTCPNRNELTPLKSSIDRNWDLLLKVINNFPEDKKYLLSPLQLSINRPQPNGIHVFVDASNILIGFMDTLKRVRGIPPWQRVPSVDLNFHALALLMERRRPVARRILAGSTPEITAFEEAREVGYETNILDKVYKAKELTERQRFFAIQDRERRKGNGYQSGGSESAGNGPAAASTLGLSPKDAMAVAFGTSPAAPSDLPPPNPKWIEQAVDEILHLKILESVVDVDIPSSAWSDSLLPNTAPTMVLATGDAAEAEYSQGFMKMVQRALSKGWNVEVAAWGKSVSQEYRRMEQSKVLGNRFKIIELDNYAEELFGESVDGTKGPNVTAA